MHKIFNDIETNVDSFVAHVNKELKEKRERLAIDRILGEIADINERVKNITHAIEMGKGINTLLDRLEELQNEKARAETNLRESRAIEKQLEEFSAEYVLGNLETLKEKMNSMETAHEVLKGITTMKVDLDSRVFEIVVFNMVSTFAV
jgi:vacuolar-type H+-ATPase subunit I/STV1